MLLLTAPSKTQTRIQREYPFHTTPVFIDESKELIATLRGYSKADLGPLMKISATLAESTHQRIEAFAVPHTPANSHPAILTFQGDVYGGLTPSDYSDVQLAHAQRQLLILSGLYGALRPLDLMMEYRLEMGLKLATRNCQNLYQFWNDKISRFINDAVADHEDPTVINLASSEYLRVVKPKLLNSPVIDIIFEQPRGDGHGTIAIHAKRARGLMIHHMISNQLDEAHQLKGFSEDGYRYVAEHSSEDRWLFRKED